MDVLLDSNLVTAVLTQCENAVQLGACGQVCKVWMASFGQPLLWSALCAREWPGVLLPVDTPFELYRTMHLAPKRWTTLEHAGVSFPPHYPPHGVPLIYDGLPVSLTTEQEEAATLFVLKAAQHPLAATDKVFRRNFMASWRPLLCQTAAGELVEDLARSFPPSHPLSQDTYLRSPSPILLTPTPRASTTGATSA